MRALFGAIHVGILLLRILSKPGSTANKTGLGQVLIFGVLALPGGPYMIALQPNIWANSFAGRRSIICIDNTQFAFKIILTRLSSISIGTKPVVMMRLIHIPSTLIQMIKPS